MKSSLHLKTTFVITGLSRNTVPLPGTEVQEKHEQQRPPPTHQKVQLECNQEAPLTANAGIPHNACQPKLSTTSDLRWMGTAHSYHPHSGVHSANN